MLPIVLPLVPGGERSLLLLGRLLKEYVGAEDDTLAHGPHEVGSSACRTLLLLLFALLVLFFLIWRRLTVIISEVDFIGEFDSKGAPLDPRGLRLQGDGLGCELLQDGIVDAGDHIGRLNEGEGETRFHVDGCGVPWEGEFHERHAVAQALVLWKDWKGDTEAGFQEPYCIFMIILVGTLEIFLGQVSMSRDLLVHKASQ